MSFNTGEIKENRIISKTKAHNLKSVQGRIAETYICAFQDT